MRSDLEKCKTCYHKYHRKWEAGICDYYDKCEDNAMYKRYTNGDRIRQADDSELQRFLCEISDCGNCFVDSLCYLGHNGYKYWLRKEAD